MRLFSRSIGAIARPAFGIAALLSAVVALAAPVRAQSPTLVGNFNPGLGALNSVAYDPLTGSVYAYANFAASINQYTPGGSFLGSLPRPGVSSNDFDMDFAPVSLTVGGSSVPANSLLVVNGEQNPPTLFAVNKTTGATLGTQIISTASSLVGGSYSAPRGSYFVVDYVSETISEINAANGSLLSSFVNPAGFDTFYGDIEVSQTTGNLYLVSDQQNLIRVLTPAGALVADINVGALGVSGMSGIALDDATGEAYLSSTNGTVYRLANVAVAVPEPGTLALALVAGLPLAGLVIRRRRAL